MNSVDLFSNEVLLTKRQVLDRIGLRSTWLKVAARSGQFPMPVRVGNRNLWIQAEVDAWIEGLKRDRASAVGG